MIKAKASANGRKLLLAASIGLVSPLIASAATTGFNQTAGGPYDYNTTGNWVSGTINGVWDPSLSLTTADQTVTFAANTALSTGLSFSYAGNKNVILRGTGGNFTLTLGGDVLVNTAGNQTITLGSTSANQNLSIDLGGATRTFTVAGGGFGGNFGRTLTLINAVSNGGLIVSGGGTGGGKVTLKNVTNTLTSLGVNGAELLLDGSGNSGANTVETVSGALNIGPGFALVSLNLQSTKNTLLQTNSFSRNSGVVLFRGTSLGVNSIASATANSTNIGFTTGPTLLGGGGAANQSTISILPGALGDSNLGSGTATTLATTAGLVTYDTANGVRLLNTATEYTPAITDQQTQLDNVRYASTGAVQTATLTAGTTTTINSLSFAISGATGTQGAVIAGGAGAILKLNSGVIYANQSVTTGSNPSAGDAMVVSVPTLDLNGKEGIIIVSTKNNTGGTVTSNGGLQITSVITNAAGLTLASPGLFTTNYMQFIGSAANTYSGTTTINGANVQLNRSVANITIPGDLVINFGQVYDAGNQIADTSNVTINGGTLYYNPSNNSGSSGSETFATLTMTGGATSPGSASGQTITINGTMNLSGGATASYQGGKLNVGGLASLSGGTVIVQNAKGANTFDGVTTLSAGLAITNTASAAYTPITINAGADATHFGGKLVLGGDVSFTGNGTNTNTATIAAAAGTSLGVIALNGMRTFNIGDGAAATDLTVAPSLTNGTSAGGLTKTGLGTLDIEGANTYTGSTAVNVGTLKVGTTSTLGTGSISVANGAILKLDNVTGTAINDNAALILASGAVVNLNFDSGITETVGPLTLGGTTYITGEFTSSNPFFTGTGKIVATPEPASLGLLGLGAFGLLSRRRRMQSAGV